MFGQRQKQDISPCMIFLGSVTWCIAKVPFTGFTTAGTASHPSQPQSVDICTLLDSRVGSVPNCAANTIRCAISMWLLREVHLFHMSCWKPDRKEMVLSREEIFLFWYWVTKPSLITGLHISITSLSAGSKSALTTCLSCRRDAEIVA